MLRRGVSRLGVDILCCRPRQKCYEMQPLRVRNRRLWEVTHILRPHEGETQGYIRASQGNYTFPLVHRYVNSFMMQAMVCPA